MPAGDVGNPLSQTPAIVTAGPMSSDAITVETIPVRSRDRRSNRVRTAGLDTDHKLRRDIFPVRKMSCRRHSTVAHSSDSRFSGNDDELSNLSAWLDGINTGFIKFHKIFAKSKLGVSA